MAAEPLPPRERLRLLFDEGRFTELGRLVRQRPLPFGGGERLHGDGLVAAWGEVHGRTVFGLASDYSFQGGSVGVETARKAAEVHRLAGQTGAPVVSFSESAGARLQEGVEAMEACGEEWTARARLSGVVPQIAAVVGPCIGAAAVTSTMADFVLWTDRGVLALAGPRVVQAATGENLSYDDIGGHRLHGRHTGLVHRLCPSEDVLVDEIRTLLAVLPSNNAEPPPTRPTDDPSDRPVPEIARILAQAGEGGFDCRQIIREVLDDGQFFELSPDFGPAVVAGLGHLGGQAVAVIASQSNVMAGALDAAACRKGARFLQTVNAFGFPLLNLVDVPGALPTVDETKAGLLNSLVRFAMETCAFRGPRISVLVRKCFGGAYACLNPKSGGGDIVVAFPDAQLGIMSGAAMASVLFKDKAPEMLARVGCRLDDPILAAERGYLDDIIDPAQTRSFAIRALRMLQNKRVLGEPPRRSSNAPL